MHCCFRVKFTSETLAYFFSQTFCVPFSPPMPPTPPLFPQDDASTYDPNEDVRLVAPLRPPHPKQKKQAPPPKKPLVRIPSPSPTLLQLGEWEF